jgi:hypothetical protein
VSPNTSVTATSLRSFDDAVRQAFAQVPGAPEREGYAICDVTRMWVTKGGVVQLPQFHVEIRAERMAPKSETMSARRDRPMGTAQDCDGEPTTGRPGEATSPRS